MPPLDPGRRQAHEQSNRQFSLHAVKSNQVRYLRYTGHLDCIRSCTKFPIDSRSDNHRGKIGSSSALPLILSYQDFVTQNGIDTGLMRAGSSGRLCLLAAAPKIRSPEHIVDRGSLSRKNRSDINQNPLLTLMLACHHLMVRCVLNSHFVINNCQSR